MNSIELSFGAQTFYGFFQQLEIWLFGTYYFYPFSKFFFSGSFKCFQGDYNKYM